MLFLKNIFFFFTATEAHDDDGLPHTLEHLVFLGSEDYPYKVGDFGIAVYQFQSS